MWHVWGEESYIHTLVKKPGGNRPLERSRRRREGNIKMGLQKVGWGMDWIDVAQDRNKWRSLLVYAVINLRFQKMLGFS